MIRKTVGPSQNAKLCTCRQKQLRRTLESSRSLQGPTSENVDKRGTENLRNKINRIFSNVLPQYTYGECVNTFTKGELT